MPKTLKERILGALIAQKNITRKDLSAVSDLQKIKAIAFDKALVEKGLISEQELLIVYAKELNIPPINLAKYKVDPNLRNLIPERIARQYHIIPVSELGHAITVAVADPFNIFAIDDLKNITGHDIDVTMAVESEILLAIDRLYGKKESASVSEVSKNIDVQEFEIVGEGSTEAISEKVVSASEEAPIIRMVDLIIQEAVKIRASDIHMEPTPENLRIRYRIDGALTDILQIPKANQNAVIVRIKIMAGLDITENRIPQDGRFKMRMGSKEVDFRVSLLPSIFGEKIVMRLLDKQGLSAGLEGLGFSPETIALFKEAIAKPFGMILVTGPTGSGKSTTLYSVINQLNSVDRNIVTIEDPVEYLVEGLTQIQARQDIGLTFANGLRAILRQSPDVVMVGEIRDSETADIAIKASLTGHLVLSTLHTNDAASALTRLVDMGVESFLVASSLVMVCAQRLCRKICPQCKEPMKIPEQAFKNIHLTPPAGAIFYHGRGCDHCRKTGYRGRMGILEVMMVDDHIREMLIAGASSYEIKKYAIDKNHMVTLWDDALRQFSNGLTTLEEVLRVTASD